MNTSKFLFIALTFVCINVSCAQTDHGSKDEVKVSAKIEQIEFTRDSIVSKLKTKINRNEPLVVHVFVPLCDNKHQAIARVGGKLGEGRNLRTNLYWGAGYGLKTWFERSKEWKFLKAELNPDSFILERLVYTRTYKNNARLFLVLDAWAGDKMKECLTVYFKSLSGEIKNSLFVDSSRIAINGLADFIIFNGHNGLMDNDIPFFSNIDQVEKDAAVIACGSYYYFVARFKRLKTYPLLLTNNLLPPEAYIISAVIDNWAVMAPEEEIRKSAARAMAKIHKKPIQACDNTFSTGW
jgi:hypothetical protein